MKCCSHRLLLPTFAFVLVFGAASAALAQSSVIGGGGAGPAEANPADQANPLAAQRNVPSAFGTSSFTIYQIPAAAFRPRQGPATYVADTTAGTMWLTAAGNGDTIAWAPVFLDTGSVISWLDLHWCDSNTAGPHLDAFFTGYPGEGAGVLTDFASLTSTGNATTPCQYNFHAFSHTIINDVYYLSGFHYAVNVRFNALNGTNKLKGADLWWKRVVSPSPLVATFTDVPLADPRNKFVEALYQAGITAGCGGGNYCPDVAVTRGQMAVFLASALGLHHPF